MTPKEAQEWAQAAERLAIRQAEEDKLRDASEKVNQQRKKQMIESRSDLEYAYAIASVVVAALERLSREAEDVTVAAKHIDLSRKFPLSFMSWVVGFGGSELSKHAEGAVPEWTRRAQVAAADIPLLTTITSQLNSAPAPGSFWSPEPFDHNLPATCIEALVLVNARARTEPDLIAAQRKVSVGVGKEHSAGSYHGPAQGALQAGRAKGLPSSGELSLCNGILGGKGSSLGQ